MSLAQQGLGAQMACQIGNQRLGSTSTPAAISPAYIQSQVPSRHALMKKSNCTRKKAQLSRETGVPGPNRRNLGSFRK